MILRYYGHSLFTLTSDAGKTLLTDPYGEFYDYPAQVPEADVVTVSHQHHDHNAVDMVSGAPVIVEERGAQIARGISVTGFASYHDSDGGAKRGENTCFLIEMDGIRVLHLGDLGHVLNDETVKDIGEVDVLLLPVGGFYTIGPEEAIEVMKKLNPAITIPMHYRTKYSSNMPIAPVDSFLSLAGGASDPVPVLRLEKEELSERDNIIVMDITSGA